VDDDADKTKCYYNKGTLHLNKEENTVTFILPIKKENPDESYDKIYKGHITYSNKIRIASIKLFRDDETAAQDISEIQFELISPEGGGKSDVLIGLAITTSAGNHDFLLPTVHRIALSNKDFDEGAINNLMPLLKLNDGHFIIEENKLDEMLKGRKDCAELKAQFERKKKSVYVFDEVFFKSSIQDNIQDNGEQMKMIIDASAASLNFLQYDTITVDTRRLIRNIIIAGQKGYTIA
jgi:hypothetical protein